VVGLLSKITNTVVESVSVALERLRRSDDDGDEVRRQLMARITTAEQELGGPLRDLETQRAVARSKEAGEAAGVPLPQCRAVAKRIARDRDLARDLDEAELERQPTEVLVALVEELEGQSREAGADETVQRQLMRRVGQATAAIKMKELRGGAIGGTGGGGGRGSPPRASKRPRGE
jgi:hypothetical protein